MCCLTRMRSVSYTPPFQELLYFCNNRQGFLLRGSCFYYLSDNHQSESEFTCLNRKCGDDFLIKEENRLQFYFACLLIITAVDSNKDPMLSGGSIGEVEMEKKRKEKV